ncbi:integrator complex subunit 13-like [Ciona intestinalis]
MSSFNLDHKTVFVLDHGPTLTESSKQNVDFDIFSKARPQGVVPLAPVSKSLWTCCMEALCEYSRVVWDIFPGEKFLRYVVSDSTSTFLNSWKHEEQSMSHLMTKLAGIGPPLKTSDCSVILGLVSAVAALCEATEIQQQTITEHPGHIIENSGRIVCITQLKNDSHRRSLEECVAEAMKQHNKLSESSGILKILSIEFVLVHVKSFGSDCEVTELRHVLPNHPSVTTEVHDVKATRHGIAIGNRMLNLLQKHYNLSVTSITGIPMKEEQHANSSANYDVLLMHERLTGTMDRAKIDVSDNELTSSMSLKWCTPKINVNELYHCTGAARISPVDVNSRPSLCLTNFLLNGRSVLLDHWQKSGDAGGGSGSSGSKNTHMISCCGSDIFLHALDVYRVPFEDPPSISDGPGGRVTDYRINDFTEIAKKAELLPIGHRLKSVGNEPINLSMKLLDRMSKQWPLVFSKTIVYNMKQAEPLLQVITKEIISDDEVVNCQRVIYHLISMEKDGTALPVSGSTTRGPNKHKREEQYKSMWNELEGLLRLHSTISTNHKQVLDCLLKCTGKESENGNEEKPQAKFRVSTKEEVFESPESPPPVKKMKNESEMAIRPSKGAQSILSMWQNHMDNQNSQFHVEFCGRLTSDSNKARLYPDIEDEVSQVQAASSQDKNDRSGMRRGGGSGGHRFGSFHRGSRQDQGKSGRSTPTSHMKQKAMKKMNKPYSPKT